jgi:transposase-like protein
MPMKKSHFTEEQIAYALRQAETGTAVTEICRAIGISEQTYYRWKKQYGGLVCGRFDGLNCSRRRTASSSSWSRT